MSLGDTHFNSLYASQPDAQGTIETKNGDIIACICAGFEEAVFNTGEGIGKTLFGSIHIKATSKTDTGFDKGDLLKHTDAFGIITTARIQAIRSKSGFMTLTMESPV
jgi:hypothetical protein